MDYIVGLVCTCAPVILVALGMGLLTVMAMGKKPW